MGAARVLGVGDHTRNAPSGKRTTVGTLGNGDSNHGEGSDMPNRTERRARARQSRRGVPQQYDQTQGRARSGMIDEHALQERSRRLADHTSGEWVPSSDSPSSAGSRRDSRDSSPSGGLQPSSARRWFRATSWTLIALSIVAFLVVMWLPSHPLWLIVTVSVIFAVGVLSLFFVTGSSRRNPHLDSHGTAV